MKNKINVGIIGHGIIGGALASWIITNNKNCKVLISDPPKGYNDDLSIADIFFISIHIPTESDYTQDLTLLKTILSGLPPNKPIFIRTTVIPGTCDILKMEFNKNIYFMPEFLTERTANEDFNSQPMIFCGEIDLLKKIFIGKKYEVMTSLEAEISKYAHNVFGALKVTFFNGIYELAEKNKCDFEKIRKGILLSGYINAMHTKVPGTDGKFGYGGKCFPKDINAFAKITEGSCLNKLIKPVIDNNNYYRNKK
jgi:UDPglucose 6-dehydrogenase